jgi:hypothetical protein
MIGFAVSNMNAARHAFLKCLFIHRCVLAILITLWLGMHAPRTHAAHTNKRKTTVSIVGDEFHINGKPTYPGRAWHGEKIQGLLLNSRMVQGIFDDRNPATIQRWAYPDTGKWDPERNTQEFLAAMPEWRNHGVLAFTINLQGGSPQGYSREQPWHNSAINADGSLEAGYMARLEKILDRADELGMVVILGYFYFGQDQRVRDEAAVIEATDNATQWLIGRGYRNVLVEINNECDVQAYDHEILKPGRIHELIERVKNLKTSGYRPLVSTSYGGGSVPRENVVCSADFLLIHGNGVSNPERISQMVRQTREIPGYQPKPILFNEDDHFAFDQPKNNFTSAIEEYASWGYFDPGQNDYVNGYQCPPVNWRINTERKRAFFNLAREISGVPKDRRALGTNKGPNNNQNSHGRKATVAVREVTYHGWPGSFVISNGAAEVIIVPSVGRVMQFRFAGDEEGPLWENRAMDGKAPDAKSSEWGNFGGDKTWPAPQEDWPKIAGRGWPPPSTFDAIKVAAKVERGGVTLISEVDPFYGIRASRRIHLDPDKPVMRITTQYEKIQGEPRRVSVWIITQLKHPLGVFAALPDVSTYPEGYNKQSEQLPFDLKVNKGLLSLKRDPKANHKIGCDAGTLFWVGEKLTLQIDSPRVVRAEYPDQGSSAEIYTNSDPLAYVELEMLGPTQVMRAGDTIERTSIYTLRRRTELEAEREARYLLGR